MGFWETPAALIQSPALSETVDVVDASKDAFLGECVVMDIAIQKGTFCDRDVAGAGSLLTRSDTEVLDPIVVPYSSGLDRGGGKVLPLGWS
jgi:hypothetical protein